MLTVRQIAATSGLHLEVSGGAEGLDREVRWLHVSELADPTAWLEGGELLLTTGLGVGDTAERQRDYVRRLARHGLAGLGFGLGFGFERVPAALAREADELRFPVLSVPYDVPFIAITKEAFARLANEELERLTQALEVHERLSEAVLEGRGVQALLGILCERLGCSLALVDDDGRIVGERHAGRRLSFEDALELPVIANDDRATLRAVRGDGPLGDEDRLVLHHGQTALAFELSRRRAVSSAELRLAGDLLDDLEHDRLDEREIERRIAAFGLDPERRYAALLAVPVGELAADLLRPAVAHALDRRATRYLSTARPDRAAFLLEADDEEEALALAGLVVAEEPGARVGVGRPARGLGLRRSLLEGPRRPRRRLGRGLVLSRPRLPRAPARASGRGAGGVRRPRARVGVANGASRRVAARPARRRLPLERRGSDARRPPAHASLPDGAARGADRPPPRPAEGPDGALARRQGDAGARRPQPARQRRASSG